MQLSPLEMFGALVVAHMLCDYPLQGDFLAKAKNHTAPIPGVPWQQALAAHSVIHGGAVWLITGIWWLGVAETILHALIDHLKCSGKIGFSADQFIHVMCKLIWILPAALVAPDLLAIIFATIASGMVLGMLMVAQKSQANGA